MTTFDDAFDYTKHKNMLTSIESYINQTISDNDVLISDINAISGHSQLSGNVIGMYENIKTQHQNEGNVIAALLTEITNIESLDVSDKETLFDFYSLTDPPDPVFMERLPYNYSGIISDAQEILSDGSLSEVQSKQLVSGVCMCYPVSSTASRLFFARS